MMRDTVIHIYFGLVKKMDLHSETVFERIKKVVLKIDTLLNNSIPSFPSFKLDNWKYPNILEQIHVMHKNKTQKPNLTIRGKMNMKQTDYRCFCLIQ